MSHENCHDLLDGMSDYIDGDASAELCAEIQRHMGGCDKCRVVVDTLRRTVMIYRRLPGPDLPEQVRERLYKVLDLSDYLGSAK